MRGTSPHVPRELVLPMVADLVAFYGGRTQAGAAYDERFGYRNKRYARTAARGNGYRLLNRILHGETAYVTDRTYDQLKTLVAS